MIKNLIEPRRYSQEFTADNAWTASQLPSTSYWVSVASGNGYFLAVAGGSNPSNAAAKSTDGSTWTGFNLPASRYWQQVAYGDNSFLVTDNANSAVAVTTNLTSWNLYSTPTPFYYAAYGAGKWVAFGSDFNFAFTSTTPSSGLGSWTMYGTNHAGNVCGVVFAGGLFIAYGQNYLITSPDGMNWTLRQSLGSSSYYFSGVAYNGSNLYVAATAGTGGNVYTSTDGLNWTVRGGVLWNVSSGDACQVAYGNSCFYAIQAHGRIGSSSGKSGTSTDGITWQDRTQSQPGVGLGAITYDMGLFVATGVGSTRVAASNPMQSNQFTWTAPANLATVDTLLIGGGGGGGYSGGGGGGAGAYIHKPLAITGGQVYTITIGYGGAGGYYPTDLIATAGGASSFGTLVTALGGGPGGSSSSNAPGDGSYANGGGGGGSGAGCGGGGGGAAGPGTNTVGTSTTAFPPPSSVGAAGNRGGTAGGCGGSSGIAGDGGPGIDGRAGGGGGGGTSTGGRGASGGGDGAGQTSGRNATRGAPGTGAGGGGGWGTTAPAANGASGGSGYCRLEWWA